MTHLLALFVAVWLISFALLRLGARVLRWIVDADTRRRTHAAYRRMVTLDQLRGHDRERDADERAATYLNSRRVRRDGDS